MSAITSNADFKEFHDEALWLAHQLKTVDGEYLKDQTPCRIHPKCFHRENCNREMCLLFFQPDVTWEDLKDAIRQWLKHDKLLSLQRAMPKEPFGPREPPTDIDRFVLESQHLFKTTLVYNIMSYAIGLAVLEVLAE